MIYIRVKEILKSQKKTKYWLVKNMGASYQSLSNLMNNNTDSIHFETLEKLCDVLDCEPGEIITRKRNFKRKRGLSDEQTTKAI